MKRLLRVAFDIFITSLTPILSWLLVGIILDKRLTNIFTLTYPIQCLMGIITCIFGVGANASEHRDKIKNSTNNGIFYGTIIAIILFGFIAINVDKYIVFMNMDKEVYRIFCRYSIIQILLQTILQLILRKLYYLEENKKANKIAIAFNLLNLIVLIGTAIITRNQILTSRITLVSLAVFDVVLLLKNVDKIDFKLNIKNCLKYDLVVCSNNIMFFIIYLFGFSNSFAYGEKYVLAITFATLVTDLQWDITHAIRTVAKVDIIKNKFDYRYHFKNALKLDLMLISSILIMAFAIYPFYRPDILIAGIFILLHIVDFIILAFKVVKMCYLELEFSAIKMSINSMIAYIIRTIVSLMPTPFCTIMGQMCSTTYELIYTNIQYAKYKNKQIKEGEK